MSTTHRNYNLVFLNKVFKGSSTKTCELISDYASPTYVNLSTYLIYVQYADDIIESILPEVQRALEGLESDDISVETVSVKLGPVNTEFEWGGRPETVSTLDFKKILQEYVEFLQASPLNGTKV
jgi:hypothetical protein